MGIIFVPYNLKLYKMRRNKDLFLELMESFFGRSVFDEEFYTSDNFQEESFEVNKGNYKTIVTCKFDKSGRPVGTGFRSEYVPTEQEKITNDRQTLQKQLDQAVQAEDYTLAAEIQAKLKSLPEKV